MGNWYGSITKAQTPEGLETSDTLTVSVVLNNTGYYFAVIYDQPVDDQGDNTKGSVVVSFSCNGGSCDVVHLNNAVVSASDELTVDWNACCTGGFVVGPFLELTTLCLDHSSLDGLDNGARYKDNSNEVSVATVSEMETEPICVTIADRKSVV